jgi:hypothetical protein
MAGEVLVHLEHGHLVLAEDPPELVVGQDFARFGPAPSLDEIELTTINRFTFRIVAKLHLQSGQHHANAE